MRDELYDEFEQFYQVTIDEKLLEEQKKLEETEFYKEIVKKENEK